MTILLQATEQGRSMCVLVSNGTEGNSQLPIQALVDALSP